MSEQYLRVRADALCEIFAALFYAVANGSALLVVLTGVGATIAGIGRLVFCDER